ncbi:MAG: alpha/beta hydrolase [Lachnospiraceae bacterium]|nr:alpha/beta hydrolase [Lachnospiraceae bacterium]
MNLETKQYYNYSKELPETTSFGELDLESPAFYPELLKYRDELRQSVAELHPDSFSMGEFDCYTIGPKNGENRPGILYLHGGAFIFPLEPMMFRNGGYYADKLGIRVFLPEYRLAPEYPFPIPFEDCVSAYLYLLEHCRELHLDPARIAVLGDSAGGALAAALCLKLKKSHLPLPNVQMLLYPVTDNSMKHESMELYSHGSWSRTANRHMWNMYLKTKDPDILQYAAPLQANDLSGLPEAYIEAAGMDCLRDEGIAYARKLEAAGTDVDLHVVEGAYHGYDSCFESPLVKRELSRRVDFLRRKLLKE